MERFFFTALRRLIGRKALAGVFLVFFVFLPGAEDSPSKDPALIWAARHNLAPLAEAMLARGVSVNERDLMGNTPLHWAVRYPAMVQFLVEHGADVNARNLLGETALHLAVYYKGSVEILLKNGVDRSARNIFGRTAVDYCMFRGAGRKNLEVMNLLFAD
ncbi:MAG: ankyrin repeat domain-containing protein [Spirochaetales bacterium]|jgi:serine/threonine-protein phosphatase 6 regulatory ankyrin repeat subunit A|nr:ankyrin repeat domain-containing protein [Spirochaetales bacterium]